MLLKFSKSKDDCKADQEKSSDGTGSPLLAFCSMALAGVALALALVAACLLWLDGQRMLGVERQQVEITFQTLGRSLSQTLGLYHESMKGLASDTDLAGLLSETDDGELVRGEQRLARLIPGVLRVRLLPPEHDKTDTSTQPPLSFASLALLRAAEQEVEPPLLELHHAGAYQAHLAGVAAIRNARGEVEGLVHLAYDTKSLRTRLDELPASLGRVELQQIVDGNYVTLFANAGEATPGETELIYPLRGSRMRLVLKPLVDPDPEGLVFFTGLGLLLATLLLAAMSLTVQYFRLRMAVEHDKAVFLNMLDETLAGRSPRSRPLKIRDFHDIMALMMQRLTAFHESGPAKSASIDLRARKGGAAEDDAGQEGPDDSETASNKLRDVLFRAYDIRGTIGATLTPGIVREIGRAIGSQAYAQGQQTVIAARDARDSSPELMEALIAGLTGTGRDVIDLGVVPIPVLYFATHFLGSDSGVMVTGSHNPPEYYSLKVVLGGESLIGADILALRERVERGDLLEGAGVSQTQDLLPDYISRIMDDVSIARTLKLVIDCGNGCTALVAPNLFRDLGCDVVELNCEVDNEYPGHYLDPTQPNNLVELRETVVREQADIGLAFNGDGDRLGVVDSQGKIIWADRLMMLLSADVLARHPGGDVVFDVKCSRALASQILQNGGRPVMWKSGHPLLKAKLRETGALLAGEWSGHILFQERWYGFDDALYVAARLLEILSVDPRGSSEVFAELPEFVSTAELFLPVNEGSQYALMEKAQRKSDLLEGAKLITIDGMRAELEDAWGLMRASNTSPALSFRFEADTEQALERVQDLYRTLLRDIAPNLQPPF